MEYSRITEKTTLLGLAATVYADVRALPSIMWGNGYELPTDGVVGAAVELPLFARPNEPAMAEQPERQQVLYYYEAAAEGQTLVDMAIQEYGTVEGLAQLMWDNASMLPNSSLNTGTSLKLMTIAPTALPAFELNYYRNTGQRVNLHLLAAAEGGYWLTEDGQPWETEDGQYWEL